MQPVAKAEIDAFMDKAFAAHAVAYSRLIKDIDGTLFENAGADALFHMAAGVSLDHDRVDVFEMEEVRQEQAGGSGADNRYLCA